MATNEATVTTDTTADGTEFVSEIHSVVNETEADGTEVMADITTTADPDDPTQVEGHATVTETAPDGTETVTEITTSADGTTTVEEDTSFSEEVYEAIFGDDTDDDDDNNAAEFSNGEVADNNESEITDDDSTTETTSADFTGDGETFDPTVMPTDTTETPLTDAGFDSPMSVDDTTYSVGATSDASLDSSLESSDASSEASEQEAHTQAATDAQNAADDFVASGDYAAAAEARETAENESWEAGDDSMLSAYDAQDLSNAADKQEDASYYEAQETADAQAGNYEAAREDASNAGYAMNDADISAGGSDHTGQADSEYTNMDNAVWQEGIADSDMDNAAYYAEAGNTDAADSALDSAAEHQGMADNYGDLGEHGGDIAAYDPSSEVETGGTYDSHVDTSYDAGTDDV
ncbi:MAG: hypothetical protein ACR2HG_03545 [Pyrinomonadaceae bacterium]